MSNSKISWTEKTWNPVTGCTKITSGCQNCYAEKMACRLKAMGQVKYEKGFEVVTHPEVLDDPYRWRKPSLVFVNSMGDLFHKDVPQWFIHRVFGVMKTNPRHIFQLLTKRSDRLLKESLNLKWTENIWMGVTVESSQYYSRIDNLRMTGAAVKFLSLEPLLTPLPDLNLQGIDWVIVGGESGANARPMQKEWVTEIRDQCKAAGVAFYFKQWSGFQPKKKGCLLEGTEYKEFPNINDIQKKIDDDYIIKQLSR
jgi:protein gp37